MNPGHRHVLLHWLFFAWAAGTVSLSQFSAETVLGAVSTAGLSIQDQERPTIMFTEFNVNGPGFNAFAVAADGKVALGSAVATNGRIWLLQADGSLDTTFQAERSFVPKVEVLAFQSDGKILAGGISTMTNPLINGVKLVRFNRNGSLDSGFNPRFLVTNPGGGFNAIEVLAGGSIFVRGDFSSINDVSRKGVALLGSDGSLDPRFDPGLFEELDEQGNGYPGQVNTIVAQSDGKLLAAGSFTSVAGVHRDNIVRFNKDGSIDPAFAPAVQKLTGLADVSFLQLQTDGKLVLAGNTTNTTAKGTLLFTLARLFTDGTVDASFRPDTQVLAEAHLASLQLQADGKILAGGNFSSGVPFLLGSYGESRWERLFRFNQNGSFDRDLTAGLEQAGGFALSPLAVDDQGRLFGTVKFLSPDLPVQTKFGRFLTEYSIPGAGFANPSLSVSETNSSGSIRTGHRTARSLPRRSISSRVS